MVLEPGTRLGPYSVTAQIGAGGMGEVYRARDTRLDRTVAIKVLPEHVAADPDLKQRFEREARTVAALNHPHICTLYDIGSQDGIDFLVMEYLEGQTLAQRLEKGALPLDQALQIAIDMTDALDKAHRQGIVHRDLKPGNIMLTKAGAKLLDFGLAKLRKTGTFGATLASAAATQSEPLTGQGTILGTVQYMAPEQLEGKEADPRTDIFALGAVLHEMVTGEKTFRGESQASLVGSILKDEPRPLSELRPVSPLMLDRVVKKCVAKDPEDRWQSAHDLTDELKWVAEGGSTVVGPVAALPPHKSWERVWMLAAVVSSLLAVGVIVLYVTRPPSGTTAVQFEFQAESADSFLTTFALSPDGRHVAFADLVGGQGIFVRSVDAVEPRLVPGTEGGTRLFWSPDGRDVGFWSLADETLKAVESTGGPVRTLCNPPVVSWGTWNQAGVILFSSGNELFRCSASGGGPTPVTALGESRHGIQPQFLPDGNHFLFVRKTSGGDGPGLYVGSLDSGDARLVVRTPYKAHYGPPGHLFFVRDQTLFAQPFDVDALQLAGEAITVAPDVATFLPLGLALFSVSAAGGLAFQDGGSLTTTQLVWLDRAGNLLESIGVPGEYDNFAVAPDETRLVVEIPDSATGTADLWTVDLPAGGMQRFTFDPADDRLPMWSADGASIIFASARGGGPLQLWQKPASGAGEAALLLATDENAVPIASDGERLVFGLGDNTSGGSGEVGLLTLSGDSEPLAVRLTPTGFPAYHYDLSPDGRWVAFVSGESGRTEVYVQNFPPSGGKWQVSSEGRWQPKWSADGKELFSLDPALGRLAGFHAVDVVVDGDTFTRGRARELFQHGVKIDTTLSTRSYYVSRDGRRFLLNTQTERPIQPVTWVLNASAELEQ